MADRTDYVDGGGRSPRWRVLILVAVLFFGAGVATSYFIFGSSPELNITGDDMPYAMIAWKTPEDASSTDAAAIEADLESMGMIPFFRGLGLLDDEEPDWVALRGSLAQTVASHPGMEAVLLIPGKGVRVGGWVETVLTAPQLDRAKKLMNQSGSNTYPVLIETQ